MQPFEIAANCSFNELMKTGCSELYIPLPSTISCDLKLVFKRSGKHIAWLLQGYDGTLNFTTDAWTFPNHQAFITITVHLEKDSQPLAFLLDIVEVVKSHDGLNLVIVFSNILKKFRVLHKVGKSC
ncbi:hypothetical protein BDN71DRAFT_1393525 [Pleurotus eryngii]|uniref:Uncharacterized protein n=1 Tax=Pleurotus eryngii TaxID=5323 RepID=A0A9P6DEN0_PLEER|nr:hypothetical protein BDN71DRAFT_1393525 [Pleurotus eryngii]